MQRAFAKKMTRRFFLFLAEPMPKQSENGMPDGELPVF